VVLIDAVWSGNFEGGEIVSPVGCITSKVSDLDLATPDARHRRPLKFFSENRRAKFLKIFQKTATKRRKNLSGLHGMGDSMMKLEFDDHRNQTGSGSLEGLWILWR
jgi:hypothetical protein